LSALETTPGTEVVIDHPPHIPPIAAFKLDRFQSKPGGH
jgi:hypothetical protein